MGSGKAKENNVEQGMKLCRKTSYIAQFYFFCGSFYEAINVKSNTENLCS